MTPRAPITDKIAGLRQRARADGAWRVWWEPNASARALGFAPVELDATRPTWSVRRARALNDDVARHRAGDTSAPAGPGGRTMAALINAYRHDPEFLDKKPATREGYARNLGIIEAKWGAFPVARFDKPVMRTWYLTNRDTRGETMAVRLNAMASVLFSFAELAGWRPEGSNPCFRLKMRIPPPRNRIANWAEIDALIDAGDLADHLRPIATAALLAVLQGQRQSDVRRATVGQFRQIAVTDPVSGATRDVWAWRVDRSKRGTLGLMQLHPLVLARVLPLLAGRDTDAPLLTDARLGRAFDKDLFQKRWGKLRAQASKFCPSVLTAPVLQFRDLRRTFAVWAKAGGAGDDDVGDVLGNSAALDPRLQETYMPPSFATASRAVLSIVRPAAPAKAGRG